MKIKKLSCEECGKQYTTTSSLRKHIRYSHKGQKPKLTCELCGNDKLYFSRQALNAHKISKHGNRFLYCNLCDFQTKVVSNLKRHQKSVHEQIKYGCRLCDLKLSSRGSLKKHIVAIHEGKTCICELCNSEFKSLSGLWYHRQSVHSGKTKVHKYDICDMLFKTDSNWKKHVKSVHLKELNYNCQFCDFSSKELSQLSLHKKMKNHGDCLRGQKFKCKVCDFESVYKASLGRHMETFHTGQQRKYNCSMCTFNSLHEKSVRTHENYIHKK